MRQYVLRRLLGSIPALIGVSLIIFLLMRVMPGDVAIAMLSPGAESRGKGAGAAEVARLRAELGLTRPLYEQYLVWVGGWFRGDLGISYWTRRPITQEILQALPVTLELAGMGLLLSLLIALPVGIISAIRQDTWQDYAGRLFSIGGLSVPEFWVGTMFIVLPLVWFQWMPPIRFVPFAQDPATNLLHFIFPALALALNMSASIMRMLRSAMLEVMRQDYIVTARSKGLREFSVIVRHALKNAFIPVITLIGGRIGRLISGSVVLEQVFALPGVGRLMIDAIGQRDYPLVQGLILLFAVVFLLTNLLVDLTYGWLDPRIRYE